MSMMVPGDEVFNCVMALIVETVVLFLLAAYFSLYFSLLFFSLFFILFLFFELKFYITNNQISQYDISKRIWNSKTILLYLYRTISMAQEKVSKT